MKVKVVKLSEPHTMGVLSFPTPERTPEMTVNETKTRGIKDKYVYSHVTLFQFV